MAKSVSLLTKKQWAAEMVTRAVGMAILSGLGGWLIGFLGGVLVVGTCVKLEGRKIEFREEDAMDRE